VSSAWARLVAFNQRLPAWATPVLLIVLAVFLGNAIFLTGLADNNPISWTANISQVVCRTTCGRTMIDPNVGYITQPLGHLAATNLLHGHIPWWNPFEGLGQPLVGEMQAAALFPLTLLFALSSGLLWFHISLEVVAGVSTYFLVRRLGVPQAFATAGGVLFALNGTYAWLGNAVLNPIAFIPMLLLGIEMIYDSAKSRSRRGWYLAPVAVALSLYSGFPEVAYFSGLFCAGWAAVRLFDVPREFRVTAAIRLAVAGFVGLLLALPALVPFYDFMKVANVGPHVESIVGSAHFALKAVPMFFDPYVYGSLFSNPAVGGFWGAIGGYFTVSVSALALLGLFGERLRRLRLYLGAWMLLVILGSFNILYFRTVWNLLPLVKTATFARYIMPTCEFAFIVLAVFGIVDFATSERARRLFSVTALFMLLVLVWGLFETHPLNHAVIIGHKTRLALAMLATLPFVAVLALLVLGRFSKTRWAPIVVALVLVGESLVMFVAPTVRSPKQVIVDQAPISYLLAHQGQHRYLDLDVLTPNWGSQYGVNSLAAIDLPIPKAFTNLVQTQLFPGLVPSNQFIIHNGLTGIIAQENQLVAHFAAYQATSLKYLLIPPGVPLLGGLAKLGVTQVFSDAHATIFEIPNPRPFFSTSSGACTVVTTDANSATVNCPNGGSTLLRTELSMAGWRASVNGAPATITTVEGVYQSIPVPKGTSSVRFSFLPPHEKYALLLGILALLWLVAMWGLEQRTVLRDRRH
jgi:hypothetical protein